MSRAVEDWLDEQGQIWQLSPAQFQAQHARAGFRPLTAGGTALRSTAKELTFLGCQIWETIVRFEGEHVAEITVSVYNRGDAGDWAAAKFEKFMGALNSRLNAWAGSDGVRLREQERTAAVTLSRKAWVKPPHQADLRWSFTAKSAVQGTDAARPEFARVELRRFDPAQDPRKLRFATRQLPGKPLTVFDLKARVKQAANGDVCLVDVPMVDQGQKGYCAAAVAERLLRYYGRAIDQHEVAQLANTTAGGGTNPEEMVKALRRVGRDLGLDLHVHLDFDFKDFEKLLNDYNRAARHADQAEVMYQTQVGNVLYIEAPAAVYDRLDPDLLKTVRVKRDAAMTQFYANIQNRLRNGVPLAWSVMLGKLPEEPAVRGRGGHMRMIIGFNDRTKEILYSDTWGAGHEQKRMALADAWTITMGLYSLQPGHLRF